MAPVARSSSLASIQSSSAGRSATRVIVTARPVPRTVSSASGILPEYDLDAPETVLFETGVQEIDPD